MGLQSRLTLLVSVALIVSAIGVRGQAQENSIRQLLLRKDLTGKPDTEVIVSHLELAPGGKVPLHTHPGDEFLYVISGGIVAPTGKPPIRFRIGQTVHFPRGKVHGGFTVKGTEMLRAITVHIIDKGRVLTQPVSR